MEVQLHHVSLTLRGVFKRVYLTGRNVKRFVDICVILGSDSNVDCTTRMRERVRFADICLSLGLDSSVDCTTRMRDGVEIDDL